MNFAQQANQPPKFSGFMGIVALHLVVGYALIHGLARVVVAVQKEPPAVRLIEQVKLIPPPRDIAPLPEPKMSMPPLAYVPPPEVEVQAPQQQNTIVATTSTQAAEVAPETKVAAPAVRTAPPMAVVGLACPNHADVRSRVAFPAQAQRMGLSGDVMVEFTVGESGQLADIRVAKSSNAVFNDAAVAAVNQLHCNGMGHEVRVRVPFAFRLG